MFVLCILSVRLFLNVANAAYLGGQEMMKVVKRDNDTIKTYLPKVIALVLQGSK